MHKEELNLNNFSYIFVIIFNNRLSLGQVSKRFLLQSTTSTTSFRATCGHGDCDQAVRSAHYEDPIHIQRQAKDLLIVARHIQYKNQTKNNLKHIQYTFLFMKSSVNHSSVVYYFFPIFELGSG